MAVSDVELKKLQKKAEESRGDRGRPANAVASGSKAAAVESEDSGKEGKKKRARSPSIEEVTPTKKAKKGKEKEVVVDEEDFPVKG